MLAAHYTCMKDKLTLTVERAAIAKAKAHAKREGTSLSKLVEQHFNRFEEESFVDKWRGKFKVPKPDPKDPRMQRLWEKYLKNDK